jgi:hypothetical protein
MANEPPPGYVGGSILPQPAVDVSMKVFAGGGRKAPEGYDGTSTLEKPAKRVPMEMFKGGGERSENQLELVQVGGAGERFRGLTVNQVRTDPILQGKSMILQVLNNNRLRGVEPEEIHRRLASRNDNGIFVLPVFIDPVSNKLNFDMDVELPVPSNQIMILGKRRTDVRPGNLDDLTSMGIQREHSLDILVLWSNLIPPVDPVLEGVHVESYPWDSLDVGSARAPVAPAAARPVTAKTPAAKSPAVAPPVTAKTPAATSWTPPWTVPEAGSRGESSRYFTPSPTADPRNVGIVPLPVKQVTPKLQRLLEARDKKDLKGKDPSGKDPRNQGLIPDPRAISAKLQNLFGPGKKKQKGGAPSDAPSTKLACGLRVRLMMPGDPLKEEIQSLDFTESEEVLFEDILGFTDPFIIEYITQEDAKGEFYEFWKAFVNYDGTDSFKLMTYNEGRRIQRFLRQLQDAYMEYLLTQPMPYPEVEVKPAYGAKELLKNILTRSKEATPPSVEPPTPLTVPGAEEEAAPEEDLEYDENVAWSENNNGSSVNSSNSYTMTNAEEESNSTSTATVNSNYTETFDLEELITILEDKDKGYEERTMGAIEHMKEFFDNVQGRKVATLRELFDVEPTADIFGRLITSPKIALGKLYGTLPKMSTDKKTFSLLFKNLFRLDISKFSVENKALFTKFFLQFIAKNRYADIKAYINTAIERQVLKGGRIICAKRKLVKRTRKASVRSRGRTSRKAHSK